MSNTIEEVIKSAQMLVDAKAPDAAFSLIKTNNLHKVLDIVDGKVIDTKDSCHMFLEKFVTVNKQMLELKDDVRKLANEPYEVLITGPTGTGKEIIAMALHGRREAKQFRAINCAGLPENLVESELFGYEAGAFTGALSRTAGVFEDAVDGTVFLDEISELPMVAQGKLLRVLQTKRVRRVGGKLEMPISCRVVCASNRKLDEMVEDKMFRVDLYARIAKFEIHTIGLDKRIEDIIPIYKALGADSALLNAIETISADKERFRVLYPFNVRTIEQHIARYRVLGKLPIQ